MTGCAISGVRFRHALQAENHILACTKPETRLGLVVSNCAQSETLDSRVPFHVPELGSLNLGGKRVRSCEGQELGYVTQLWRASFACCPGPSPHVALPTMGPGEA